MLTISTHKKFHGSTTAIILVCSTPTFGNGQTYEHTDGQLRANLYPPTLQSGGDITAV